MLDIEWVDITVEPRYGDITTRLTNGWLLVQRFDWWIERNNEVCVRVREMDVCDCDVEEFSDEENAFLDECEFDAAMVREHIEESDVYKEAVGAYFYG